MCRRVARISALLTGPAEAAVDVGTRPCDAGPVATTNILTELLQEASMQAVLGVATTSSLRATSSAGNESAAQWI